MHLKFAVGLCLFLCPFAFVFLHVIFTFSYKRVPSMGLRVPFILLPLGHSGLGSNYPIKLLSKIRTQAND